MRKWLDGWEPYEGRLSRTVLRGAMGEVPVVYLLVPVACLPTNTRSLVVNNYKNHSYICFLFSIIIYFY